MLQWNERVWIQHKINHLERFYKFFFGLLRFNLKVFEHERIHTVP